MLLKRFKGIQKAKKFISCNLRRRGFDSSLCKQRTPCYRDDVGGCVVGYGTKIINCYYISKQLGNIQVSAGDCRSSRREQDISGWSQLC
jgi:hypothetical protein